MKNSMNVSEIPVGYNILECKKCSININIKILSAIYNPMITN